jgi:predicted site-specific integrase-resolvase
MKIKRIPRQRDLHKKRVAAYCRVSTLLEEQEESFDVHVKYYTRFIKAHEDWEFAGIYSDEKSGRKTENRPGFQSLIEDALDGKIDKIICKSVSRFAGSRPSSMSPARKARVSSNCGRNAWEWRATVCICCVKRIWMRC